MPTANTIVADALGCIGVCDPTDAVAAEDASLGLRVLNRIVDGLGVENLMALATVFQPVTVNAGVASRTIGTAGDVAVSRPVRFELGAYVRVDGVDHSLTPLTRQQYGSISDKTSEGVPRHFYYEPTTSALGTIYFWPVPSTSVTCYMPIQTRLTQFADLTTTYGLADGYEGFLAAETAVKLAPFYNREAPGSVIAEARNLKRMIKRANFQVPQLQCADLVVMGREGSADGNAVVSGDLDIY